jgi:hypothetical protein
MATNNKTTAYIVSDWRDGIMWSWTGKKMGLMDIQGFKQYQSEVTARSMGEKLRSRGVILGSMIVRRIEIDC